MSQQLISHNYYYGSEAEQYTFYRFPKALFTNDLYKNLSDGAKILYGLMLDRMGLSLKNGWVDEENRVFIYFTLEHLQEYMNCGHNKGVKLMSELEKIGLIERVKQGLGKPAIIYVKQFSVGSENPVKPPSDGSYQQSYQQNYSQGNPDFRKGELQTSRKRKQIRIILISLILIIIILVRTILSNPTDNRVNRLLVLRLMDWIRM